MINFDEKKKIGELYLCQKRSINFIAKELRRHRATVTKVIRELEGQMGKAGLSKSDDIDWMAFLNKSLRKPEYNDSNRKGIKVTPEIRDKIRGIWKTSKMNNRMKVYETEVKLNRALFPEVGQSISYETFCNVIRDIKKETPIIKKARNDILIDEVLDDWDFKMS